LRLAVEPDEGRREKAAEQDAKADESPGQTRPHNHAPNPAVSSTYNTAWSSMRAMPFTRVCLWPSRRP
jgi:hypothetical protein